MKRIIKITLVFLFSIFSFYYTNKLIDLSLENDPIMKKINSLEKESYIKPTNAIISENTMKIGTSSKIVNKKLSYERMKKINKYNKNLLEYTRLKPIIKKEDNYEKLITGSNTDKKEIALVFVSDDLNYIKQILYILNTNNTCATFFTDGKIIKNNINMIKSEARESVSFGIYSYDGLFNTNSIKYMRNFLTDDLHLTNYCLYQSYENLKECVNMQINTIKPEKINSNLYINIKNSKLNGNIYDIKVNKNNIKELNSVIIYLKQKGYKIKSVDQLLKE